MSITLASLTNTENDTYSTTYNLHWQAIILSFPDNSIPLAQYFKLYLLHVK